MASADFCLPMSCTLLHDHKRTLHPTLALVILALVASSAEAAVGRTAGNFNVSSTGAANYTIPIFTPPGPNGMQPSVALAYNSNGGLGVLGRGWAIAGLSSITRCNHTIAQDGAAVEIKLAASDKYCLDGQRLRVQSGYNGQAGSVYATEVADFSRITAYGTTSSPPLYYNWGGPQSWIVERKDGTKYTYGSTTDSQVLIGATGSTALREWMVSQIEDRYGNKIKFTYKTADSNTIGTTHPVKIEWTQTSHNSGSYVYSMEFDYGANANSSVTSPNAYQAGSIIRNSDLLTNIRVKTSGTTVRRYVLDFSSGAYGQKRLWKVTECADENAYDCLQPTIINYQGYAGGVESSPILSVTGTPYVDAPYDPNGRFDFNGDGLRDLAYRRSGTYRVRFGQSDGTYSSEFDTTNAMPRLVAGDPAGSGRDVLLGVAGSPQTWHVYSWNGSSFSATSTGASFTFNASYSCLCDVDGDGRDDLVYGYHNNEYFIHDYAMVLETLPSTSTGSTISFGSPVASNYYYPGVPGWFAGGIVHSSNDDPWTLGNSTQTVMVERIFSSPARTSLATRSTTSMVGTTAKNSHFALYWLHRTGTSLARWWLPLALDSCPLQASTMIVAQT